VVAPAICAVGLAVGVFGLGSTVHKHVVKGKDPEPEQFLQVSHELRRHPWSRRKPGVRHRRGIQTLQGTEWFFSNVV